MTDPETIDNVELFFCALYESYAQQAGGVSGNFGERDADIAETAQFGERDDDIPAVSKQGQIDSWLGSLIHDGSQLGGQDVVITGTRHYYDSDNFFNLTETFPITNVYKQASLDGEDDDDNDHFINELTSAAKKSEYKCILDAEFFTTLCELWPLLPCKVEKLTVSIISSEDFNAGDAVKSDVVLMLTPRVGLSLSGARLYSLEALDRSFSKMDLVFSADWEIIGRFSLEVTDSIQRVRALFTPTVDDLVERSVYLPRDMTIVANLPKLGQDGTRSVSEFLSSPFCAFEQSEISVTLDIVLNTHDGYVNYDYAYYGTFKKQGSDYTLDIALDTRSQSDWDFLQELYEQKHAWRVGTAPSDEELKFKKVSCYDQQFAF